MLGIAPSMFIAKKPLQPVTNTATVSNCGAWLPNSNCNSVPTYAMPNAHPSTWTGVTGLAYNNPGYDFAGGATTSDSGIASINVGNIVTTATLTLGVLSQTSQTANNCNCNPGFGAGVFNCYTNCNCNCNCNCDCNCNCNCACSPE